MSVRYLLDTNILSEPLKPTPDVHVMAQLTTHESEIAIASVVLHELSFGIERLVDSHRRRRLESYLNDVILATIPIISYDKNASLWHGRERARLLSQGQSKPFADSQIAAIAVVNQLILVTRNIRDFDVFEGLVIENWYQSSSKTRQEEG